MLFGRADGFSFRFIKKYLEIMKDDVCGFVDKFFQIGSIPDGCNSSFITFIPKVDSPTCIKDYRLVSLVGVQYKTIA